MEFGGEESPKWLSRLTGKNDETHARRKFGIPAEEKIVFGTGTRFTLEDARAASQTACLKKILGGQEGDARILNGVQPVFEHWVQDGKAGFTIVSVNTLQK